MESILYLLLLFCLPHLLLMSVLVALLQCLLRLWHNRLGHPCANVLNSAMSNNSSVKLSTVSDICSKYTSCISAKMHKLPLQKHVSSIEYHFQ